jgi:ferredoxin
MPKLTVENVGTFDVEAGKRLVLALVEDAAVDQLHACGGNCKCTTCRVAVVGGEPAKITVAEKEKLEEKGLTGVRLSCQLLVEDDMAVQLISRLEGSGRPDSGPPPETSIQPEPEWTTTD